MDPAFNPSEHASLHLLRSGDHKEWEKIIVACTPMLRSTIRSFLSDSSTIEELLQETWVTAYANSRNIKAESLSSFRAFLRTIARHKCLDQLHNKVLTSLDMLDIKKIGSRDFKSDVVLEMAVESIVRTHNADTQEEWFLRLQGYTLAEIAGRVNRPLGSVARRINRLQQKLIALLFTYEADLR